MRVEVAYATPQAQTVLHVEVPAGSTVEEVIRVCGVLDRFPDFDLAHVAVGIFSERVALDTTVQDGDRVELYRPLIADPKEARRRRARKR